MKNREVILAELGDLNASFGAPEFNVATLQAPEGYFQHFPVEMTAIIKAMNSEDAQLPQAYQAEAAYTVPDQYFAQLPELLLSRVRAADELIHKGNYTWDNAAKQNPYTLPENYFDQFESQLMARISEPVANAQAEIDQLSPLLAGLRQQQVFEVPQDYFQAPVAAPKPVRTVEHPSVKSIKWARWAAAAAILIIFGLGAFQMFNPAIAEPKQSFQQSLAQIPSDSIREWLSTNMDEEDINSLGNSVAGLDVISTSSVLKGFTDKEIEQYIESEVW
ncbi:hypothetical protein B0I18_11364 [Taibaiella chishuiensis]|uniref:Uncharacterized protein n=2 Tax=Taibaiella chishuiensis TaxID=1434707 RepID=A0A2P8CVQ3_9BACT|nr:hypothetical protein B0I18_11364 [Taibaiella chishuiensis]